jgi:hypothetical protein
VVPDLEGFVSPKAIIAAALVAGAMTLAPSLAEAQARGTLQVTAVVVRNGPAIEGLRSAQAAVQQWINNKTQIPGTVPTLSTVTVTASSQAPEKMAGRAERSLVVTVDYSRN